MVTGSVARPFGDVVGRMRALLLIVLAPTMLALSLLTPPFWVADEPPHYMRANGVSRGAVLPVRTRAFTGGPAAGGPVDAGFMAFFRAVTPPALGSDMAPTSRSAIARVLYVRYPTEPALAPYSNTAIYPPILYLPAAFAIGAARAVGTTQLVGFYAGRIANVLAAVIVLYLLLGRAGRLAPFVLCCAAVPVALFGTASLSADALLMPLTIGFACLLARLPVQSRERQPWALAVATVLLTVGKIAYVPLSAAPVIAAAWLDQGWSARVRFLAVTCAIAVAGWAAWAWAVHADVFSIRPGVAVDPAGQLKWIAAHPRWFLHMAAHQIVADRRTLTLGVFGWRMGWGNIGLPGWTSIVTALALAVAGCGVPAEGARPWPLFAVFAAMTVVCAAVIGTLLYLQYNAVGASSIEGVQGRYLLPLVIFLAPWVPRPRRTLPLASGEVAALISALVGADALLHAAPTWWAA